MERFAIVARRKGDKMMFISPDGSMKNFVAQNTIEAAGIRLGDCCLFEFHKNNFRNLRKESTNFEEDVTVEVSGDNIVVCNVPGEIKKIERSGDIFFDTRIFGKVAYLGNEGLEAGRTCRINLELLDEDYKVGNFTNFTWSGSLRNSRVEESENTQKKVIGLVVGEINFERKYVWARGTYTGQDGIIMVSEEHRNLNLRIGTWIEMTFDQIQFRRYFPENPDENTIRFVTKDFKIIDPVFPTMIGMYGNNVELQLKNVKIEEGHVAGDDIHNPELGLISDYLRFVRSGSGFYNIGVARTKPKAAKCGRNTVWKTISATKVGGEGGNHNERRRSRSRGRNDQRHGWVEAPTQRPARSLSRPRAEQVRGRSASRPRNNVVVNNEIETFPKRAVIMSIMPNKYVPGGSTYFLWLIDDHIKSIYYTQTTLPDLYVGHIFKGKFKKTEKNPRLLECDSHVCPLDDELDDVITSNFNNQLEMEITINKKDPSTLKTNHEYIGEINDIFNLLPADCSNGVRILTTTRKSDGGMIWFVKKIIKVDVTVQHDRKKKQELIDEFFDAWKVPLLRKYVNMYEYDPAGKLEKYYASKRQIN